MRRSAYIHAIEEMIALGLVILEYPNVLEDLRLDRNTIVVPNGIFTEEIEDDEVGCFEGDVFAAQRAAPDGVSFVFTFLVPGTKSQPVDEVHGCGPLPVGHDLVLEVGSIFAPDGIDVILDSGVRMTGSCDGGQYKP
jgi:hypothetical protein